ncbi:Beta-lactamase-like protein 2 [Fusarium austroafricanum]|uniref:Beta-lactamase-like protein 2 n=1 Tax=Fusarium austroafricanum TaxID=2364996 RepID=A0A8H4JWN9_9HYPO|nr:Beta-lactamase-like protein 2 [Fusarium austroafricanum]
MHIKAFGAVISASLCSLVTVRATGPCPLFGPDLPMPTVDASLRDTMSDILKVLHPGAVSSVRNLGIDFQNTSFSMDIYSVKDQKPLANFHHAAPALNHHKYGTRIVNDTSIYRIGSVSKLLTTYLYLLEVGDVSFNEPITRYVPELTAMSRDRGNALRNVDWNTVTIGALASHMAGIPRDFPNPPSSDRELARLGFPPVPPVDVAYCGKTVQYPCNRSAVFDAIKMHHPVEAPFETPIYSNIGYQLLGYALENITGSKYPDILFRRLIKPLRLNSTTYSKPANDEFSVIPDTPSSSSYDVDMGDAGPAGSIYSSIADLRRIGQSILSYEMLSPSQTRRWMKPLTFTADPNLAVGAPWEIARAPSTTKRLNWIYTKGGDLGMYKSLVSLMPDWGIGMTVLAAGTGVSELFNAVTGQMASELVASLEQAAKRQANLTYSGIYGDRKSNMTIAVQKDLPGLAVTSWFFKGRDMFDWVRVLVAGSQTGPGNVSMRLYPTGLQEREKGKASRESWRAIYEILDDGAPSSPYCASWFGVDSVTYGGVSVDEFVIDHSQDGTAQGLTVSAFDTRLKRAKH